MTNLKVFPSGDPAIAGDPPDPFDLASLCLSQDFTETVGVKKLLRAIPARRPNSRDFVRVHPSPDYRRNFLCVVLKDDREIYLVRPEVAPDLAGETAMKTIYTAVTRQGVVLMWPVTIPSPDGKTNEWWRSEREAAELAISRWIRVKADMSLGAYQIYEAERQIRSPNGRTSHSKSCFALKAAFPSHPATALAPVAGPPRNPALLDIEYNPNVSI
jgi:hypothetical protein